MRAFLCVFLAIVCTSALPIYLDMSFGPDLNGVLIPQSTSTVVALNDVHALPNGKYIAAGSMNDPALGGVSNIVLIMQVTSAGDVRECAAQIENGCL